MEKLTVVNKLKEIHIHIVDELKKRIEESIESVDIDEEDVLDKEDFSHQDESSEMRELLQQQLFKAVADHNRLSQIDFSSKKSIIEGAFIETEKFTFILSIATTPFVINEKQYIGISNEAPIFSAMKDKNMGDEFSYGSNNYKIVSIN